MEVANITMPIHRNRHGWHTCRLDAENQCQFLGFRKFGQVPVCMKGKQHDIDFYNSDPVAFIEPDCGLADKHLTTAST